MIRLEGSHGLCLAINWRFTESAAALKGLEAVMINMLLKKKYGVKPVEVFIKTLMSFVLLLSKYKHLMQ